jgi:hypothetical protein
MVLVSAPPDNDDIRNDSTCTSAATVFREIEGRRIEAVTIIFNVNVVFWEERGDLCYESCADSTF